MKVLVTGATGFAGRTLVAALAREGDEVRALVRAESAASRREGVTAAGATCVTGDVGDQASVARAAEGCEVVFHCARSEDPTRPRAELEALDLVGTENTLAAARAAGVRRMVHLSSADVTRGLAPRSYVDEDFPQPPRFVDAASEALALAEDLVSAASDARLETVVVRAAWLWGAGDTCLAPRLLRAAREGSHRWIDGGRSLCATTHARTLADAMRLAARVPEAAARTYYVTDDERVTVREFLTRLAGALGVRLGGASLPFWPAYALAWLADVRGARGERARVLAHGRSAHFNVQRARKELGWAPALQVSEGLREVQAWAERVGVEGVLRGDPA